MIKRTIHDIIKQICSASFSTSYLSSFFYFFLSGCSLVFSPCIHAFQVLFIFCLSLRSLSSACSLVFIPSHDVPQSLSSIYVSRVFDLFFFFSRKFLFLSSANIIQFFSLPILILFFFYLFFFNPNCRISLLGFKK